MKPLPVILALWTALAVTACVNTPQTPAQAEHRAAEEFLKQAAVKTTPPKQRAALYLSAAAEAGYRGTDTSDRASYNKAAAELTVLLRSADNGRLWNHPLTLTCGTTTYQLHFAKGTRDGIWDPGYFTSFALSDTVHNKEIKRINRQDGLGGALVGVHQTNPLEHFSPKVGVTAPVTAVLDFKGRDVTLTLYDPSEKPKTRVAGAERQLAADFTAPLAYYPHQSEFWNGLMGAIRVQNYMGTTGLYMLQPYDPDRIPVIFVHGLISTARMWRNVINELESDPLMRGRYQCWVFAYPTGNPPAYSALRFREELDKLHHLHPDAKPYVLVGHSMGGLLSHMLTTTVTRESWEVLGKDKAHKFFAAVKKGSLVEQAATFNANHDVGRVVFICTPHRGSEMALGKLAAFAQRLIFLPVELTSTITSSLVSGDAFAVLTGSNKSMPTSVTGLAPTNPMYKVLDTRPIEVPYHSIIGDRGKGDTPNSSDGVVKYWSSHLAGAQSERIVPGPHGACEMPETIAEVDRILRLHLKQGAGIRRPRDAGSHSPDKPQHDATQVSPN
jgi:pimeloyl-ACP methyl ester carboxylesterase